MRRIVRLTVLIALLAACGGGDETGTTASAPSSTTTAAASADEPVQLDVVTETTTTTAAAAADWEVGGSVTATGPLAGTFEVAPLCDVRNDADGEFLNIAFGYQDLDDAAQPTVRIVVHVRGWQDQGDFVTDLEAQYQTGSGMDLALQDAAGEARLSLAFIDTLGGVQVTDVDLDGDFDGAVTGTVSATLICLAG
jgi:hypothetical protein